MTKCLQRAWKAGNHSSPKAHLGMLTPRRHTRSYWKMMARFAAELKYRDMRVARAAARLAEEERNKEQYVRATIHPERPNIMRRVMGRLRKAFGR